MIKGLYSAVSAMLASLSRQNALAHNISNLDTPGFKQILVSLEDYLQVPVNDLEEMGSIRYQFAPPLVSNFNSGSANQILGELGLGVEAGSEGSDFSEGGLGFTGHQLDLAIQGTGFFRILTPDGERYTRDGRFTRDSSGQLVTVDGYQVLDGNGNPITIPDGVPSVNPEGQIFVSGDQVASLGIATFEAPTAELIRDQGNLFSAEGGPTGTEVGFIRQGYLEDSNVNLAQVMTQMVAVGRAYEAAQQLVQIQDDLLGRTISTLGRM